MTDLALEPTAARMHASRARGAWRAVCASAAGRIVLTALAYLVLAHAAHVLALPPGYSSPVWPAAGLALAAVLKWGLSALPGVWLGALCFNLGLNPSASGAAVACLIACGSALQAVVGARLAHRLYTGTGLSTRSGPLLFLQIVRGPLVCLIAASVGIATLYGFGLVPRDNVLQQWLAWAAGDTLGVLLFTPLFIRFWPAADDVGTRRARPVALPLFVTALLLALGHLGVSQLEAQRLRAEVDAVIDAVLEAAVQPLREVIEPLRGVERMLAVRTAPSQSDFATYTRRIASRDTIVAIEWVPRVVHTERDAFEQRMSADVVESTIVERDAQGGLRRALPAAEYFPVLYSEPQVHNADRRGWNLQAEAAHAAVMAAARDSAEPAAASARQVGGGGAEVLVFVPVYRPGFDAAPASLQARRDALRGHVVGRFDTTTLFEPLAELAKAHRLAFRVSDVGSAAPPHLLIGSSNSFGAKAAIRRSVVFADREWRIEIEPEAVPYAASWFAHAYLAISVFIALWACLAFIGEAIRTEQLERSHLELKVEMDERAALLGDLRESEERFRMLTQLSTDWFWEQDADLRFTQITEGAHNSGGVPREGHVGKRRWELPNSEIVGGDWAPHQAALAAREPFRNLLLRRTLPEGPRYVLVSGAPRFAADGAFLGYRGVAHDVTADKHAELALIAARDAADEASRAKSAFLANMSHEIRTPMNGVIGMLDVLAQGELSAPQEDAVQTIRDSAFALLGLIDSILDFSKIEAGHMALERVAVEPGATIESLCRSLAGLAASKNVLLSVFVDPRLPPALWSDPTRLGQMLNNLVGNAIKFSGGRDVKGRVAVRAQLTPSDPPRLCLSVSDNGIGMSEQTIAGLFTSFMQAESSTTRRFGGTGLGLAITRRLVELMQGTITVDSTLGGGSTLRVELPIEPVPGHPRAEFEDLSGLDCIVVASPELDGADLCTYLQHAGATVQLAEDDDDACRRAEPATRAVIVRDAAGAAVDAGATEVLGRRTPQVLLRRDQRGHVWAEGDRVTVDADALRRGELVAAVAMAAGRLVRDRRQREAAAPELAAILPRATRVADARAQQRLVLVAEDDAVNQKVIVGQLSLLGYAAEVANDGSQALRLWRAGGHALLLSDLHMPVMDGQALARSIRAAEQQQAAPTRLPILALTANALRGEASHAHAAGMDEYLTKPIQLHVLKAALEKWMPAIECPAPAPAPAHEPVELSVLRSLVGDDAQTIAELLCDYRDSLVELGSVIRDGGVAGDLAVIAGAAHRLKSSSRAIGAMALGELCAALEQAGRAGRSDDVGRAIAGFDDEKARVIGFLDRQAQLQAQAQ